MVVRQGWVKPSGMQVAESTQRHKDFQFDRVNFNPKLKNVAKIIVVVGVATMMFLVIGFVVSQVLKPNSWMVEIAKTHFAAVVELPFIGLLSACLVVVLEFSFGTIELEGFEFKFNGATGPIVLWAIYFLTITVAVKLLS